MLQCCFRSLACSTKSLALLLILNILKSYVQELIERCTKFSMKMGQNQKAVQLLTRKEPTQYEAAADTSRQVKRVQKLFIPWQSLRYNFTISKSSALNFHRPLLKKNAENPSEEVNRCSSDKNCSIWLQNGRRRWKNGGKAFFQIFSQVFQFSSPNFKDQQYSWIRTKYFLPENNP